MTAIALALLAAATWGTSDTLGGLASRGRPVLAVMAVSRTTGVLLLGLVAVVFGAPDIGGDWTAAVAAGAVLFGAIFCLYRALAIGPMSVVAPIFATGAAVPVVAGLAGGEDPGVVALVGLAIALAGTVVTARAPAVPGMTASWEGVALAVGAAVLIGAGLALVDHAARDGAVTALLVERATEAVIALVVVLVGRRRLVPALRPIGTVPAVGVLDSSAALLFALASRSGLLPVVSVLASLYPVVTVLLARAFLSERMSGLQAGGAGLTLAGVAVVAATGG